MQDNVFNLLFVFSLRSPPVLAEILYLRCLLIPTLNIQQRFRISKRDAVEKYEITRPCLDSELK